LCSSHGGHPRSWAPLITDLGVVVVLQEDRELLAELARINTDIPALGLRMMEGSASAAEQVHYGERLMSAGQRIKRRAESTDAMTIEGEFHVKESVALPAHTAPAHTAEPSECDRTP
jgi:hypothetical protein